MGALPVCHLGHGRANHLRHRAFRDAGPHSRAGPNAASGSGCNPYGHDSLGTARFWHGDRHISLARNREGARKTGGSAYATAGLYYVTALHRGVVSRGGCRPGCRGSSLGRFSDGRARGHRGHFLLAGTGREEGPSIVRGAGGGLGRTRINRRTVFVARAGFALCVGPGLRRSRFAGLAVHPGCRPLLPRRYGEPDAL